MSSIKAEDLTRKKCVPCEGGVPGLTVAEIEGLMKSLPNWHPAHDAQRIRRQWKAKNFAAALAFFNQVGTLAEEEGHHPDLHLEGYRNVAIEIWTHAIGGLSENDFILAAKIEEIPWDFKG